MMKFDMPTELSSIIKVIGVGGGGSNAVNHMYKLGIKGVDFIVCNTDQQAIDISPVPLKIQLGSSLTEGRGAGSIPEVGRQAALENLDEIKEILSKNTKMVFITAGMGGGTGTGAAPVFAQVARELGILSVGIVTLPFAFEGKKRRLQAEEGIDEMKEFVDTLLVISNDKLREIYGDLKLTEAFGKADNVLTAAAKSIAEIITVTLHINVDFADIRTVMKDSGVAIMGSASAEGENRAIKAVEMALSSPLLNDNDIKGARYVLLSITCGTDEISMDELGEITDYIQDAAGQTAEIIKGYGIDESLGNKVNITVIATGFNRKTDVGIESFKKPARIVRSLEDEVKPVPAPASFVQPEVKPEPVVEVKVQEPVKAEAPAEEKNESLEPFLIVKPEKEEARTVEFEITNSKEKEPEAPVVTPAMIWAEPEVKAEAAPIVTETKEEVVIEPVAEVITPLVEAEIQAPVAVEEIPEPVAAVEIPAPVVAEETPAPIVAEETPAPVIAEENLAPVIAESLPFPVIEVAKPAVEEKVSEPVAEVKTPEPVKAVHEIIQQAEEAESKPTRTQEEELMHAEQVRKAQERISKLRELSMKLKTPNGLNELEKEPAYKRKNVSLDSTPHSSESQVSRYTLSENEEKNIEIRPNNSFLHDNVD